MDARRTLGCALLPALFLLACGDDEEGTVPAGGSLALGGHSLTTPSIEGAWDLTAAPTTSDCGALSSLFPTAGLLDLTQVGNEVVFDLADACGRSLPGGAGRIDPGGTLELTSDATLALTPSCTLRIHQVRTGSTSTPPESFSGADVLTITGSVDCDPSLHCAVSGTFAATSCPRSGCALTCPP